MPPSVWRAFERMGLATCMRVTKHEGDMRRFTFLNRMQMVLCDGKKFRAGAARLRRVALFYLDDSSRYGLQVVVGTEETSELFLRGLYKLICRYGSAPEAAEALGCEPAAFRKRLQHRRNATGVIS